MKLKWPRGKEFFFVGITLEGETAVSPPPTPVTPPRTQTITIRIPENYTLTHIKHETPNVIQISAPENVEIQLEE
ncbi:MAG: hypothetical protein AAF614_42300 [Chloroflexota bacterium]